MLTDTVDFFTTTLPQCPFFRERKPAPGRIIYAPAAQHRRLFVSGKRRRNGIIHFAGIKYHQIRESCFKITKSSKKNHVSPLQKRASIVFASDRKSKKVAATSEREIGKGEMRFCVVGDRSYETLYVVQEIVHN